MAILLLFRQGGSNPPGINATVGAYAWSATTATTSEEINSLVGAWTWTGTTALASQLISASPGSWIWTGTDATTSEEISSLVGAWIWSAPASTLSQLISASTGAWSWNGVPAGIVAPISAQVGSWAWSGVLASIGAGHIGGHFAGKRRRFDDLERRRKLREAIEALIVEPIVRQALAPYVRGSTLFHVEHHARPKLNWARIYENMTQIEQNLDALREIVEKDRSIESDDEELMELI